VIRSIEAGDAEAWAMLRARLWPNADAAELAREVHAFLEGSAVPALTAVFIAHDGSTPLGFLELAVRPFSDGCDSMPVPHVEGWYVEPFARRRGVGRELLRSAEEWARTRGFTELASDTEIENDASLRAHLRCGFDETDRLIKFRKLLVERP
jgi:aminoglycoside 6'-N-acetyltransferase I